MHRSIINIIYQCVATVTAQQHYLAGGSTMRWLLVCGLRALRRLGLPIVSGGGRLRRAAAAAAAAGGVRALE